MTNYLNYYATSFSTNTTGSPFSLDEVRGLPQGHVVGKILFGGIREPHMCKILFSGGQVALSPANWPLWFHIAVMGTLMLEWPIEATSYYFDVEEVLFSFYILHFF